MTKRLKDKVVFITGASSGIGEACARQFTDAGAKVIATARRLNRLESLKADLGDSCHIAELDVCSREAVESLVNSLPESFSKIDILLNNAGLAAGKENLADASIADWDAMIDTNIKGLLYVSKAILPKMQEANSGHIINIGSIAGREAYPGGSVYCATKFAVRAISRALRMELLDTNIRVSNIEPGAVETEFSLVRFKGDQGKADAVYEGTTPLVADDIAELIVFTASRPEHVNISELLVFGEGQGSATQVFRRE